MIAGSIGIVLILSVMAQQTELITQKLMHHGLERSYHTYTPANFDGSALIALHPTVSSGKAMAAMTDLNEEADEHGFMTVYPNSYNKGWTTGRAETGLPVLEEPVDDLGFILALRDQLIESHNVDPDRIFLTGHSSGGGLAYLLACNAPEQFAGVAVVGTLMWNFQADACESSDDGRPVNLLVIQGSNDLRFPLAGQVWPNQQPDTPYLLRTLGVEQTMSLFLDRSGCNFEATQTTETVTFTECADGVQLSLYVVPGAGHGWFRTGDYALNQTGVDATEFVTRWMVGDTNWAQPPDEITSEYVGLPRSYRYYVPSNYNGEEALPLVMVLHGRPDNGLGIAYITDMNLIAEKEGFVALYPDGIDYGWNYFFRFDVATGVIDDIQFFRDLIADISLDVNIDPNRIYVTGFSNGGFMTQLLACEGQDMFAAFAPVGSTLFPGLPGICRVEEAEPVPMLFIHGTDDVSIPWTGNRQPGLDTYISFPVPQTLGFWATHNGCDLEAQWEELPVLGDSPGTKVVRNNFPNCAEGSALTFYLIDGGGHNWPGVPGVIGPFIAGRVNQDIHGSQVVWDFFKQHTKN